MTATPVRLLSVGGRVPAGDPGRAERGSDPIPVADFVGCRACLGDWHRVHLDRWLLL